MKKNTKVFEIVWYSLCGAIALWGITYTTLGLIGDNISPLDNPLKEASDVIAKNFGLGFVGWGLILISIAAILSIIVLLSTSKQVDRNAEKEARRQARRQLLLENTTEEKTEE
jgi:hypothetical protein